MIYRLSLRVLYPKLMRSFFSAFFQAVNCAGLKDFPMSQDLVFGSIDLEYLVSQSLETHIIKLQISSSNAEHHKEETCHEYTLIV